MRRLPSVIVLAILFIDTSSFRANSGDYSEVDKSVEIVRQLCLAGDKYNLSVSANGNLVFSRLIPGAEAKVEIDSRKAFGAIDYFDESIRIYADEQIINCMKPYIPQILSLIREKSTSTLPPKKGGDEGNNINTVRDFTLNQGKSIVLEDSDKIFSAGPISGSLAKVNIDGGPFKILGAGQTIDYSYSDQKCRIIVLEIDNRSHSARFISKCGNLE